MTARSAVDNQAGLAGGMSGQGKQPGERWGAARPDDQPNQGLAVFSEHDVGDELADRASHHAINFKLGHAAKASFHRRTPSPGGEEERRRPLLEGAAAGDQDTRGPVVLAFEEEGRCWF